ncbi:MAG: FecR family protein [Pedobacter sp.]|nr:MAG: FecR family protein [Pedobacter sp.]
MTQEEAVKLLQKYLAGNADQDEITKIEEWYGSLPTHQSLAHDRKLQIAESMRQHINYGTHSKSAKTQLFYSPWIKIAALLLVTLSVGLLFWKTGKQISESKIELTAYTNANQRKEITLPDSSKVILEPNTKITYPAHFSAEKRIVKLIGGDAFFSVVHESKRSFQVKLNSNLEVKVLGTSFRISDIADEDLLKITVATGKVAVRQATRSLGTLTRGEVLSFNKKSGKSAVQSGASTKVVKITFDGSSLAEVIQKMEYIYNIKIQVSQQRFLNLKCTADFNSGQAPSEILDILCDLHHLRLSESKDHKRFKIYQ